MACDVNTLLSEGKCFQCLSPLQSQLVELQLLCQIYAASGKGSGTQVFRGTGSPEGSVSHDGAAIYYTTAGGVWVALTGDGGNTGWSEIISDRP